MKKISMFIVTLLLVFILVSCTDTDPVIDDVNRDKETEVEEQEELLELTIEELSMYDGKDGNKAYIAVDGNIYDVTSEWGSSTHNGVTAGTDASTQISAAPHGKSILEGLEKVGILLE